MVPGTHALLNDTGAQFSAISHDLVRQHGLVVQDIKAGEPRCLSLAERSKTVPRVGTTTIPIAVHFDGSTHRDPYTCTKQFEVIAMHYDFLLGVDILPHLFPDDEIMKYTIPASCISSPPQSSSVPADGRSGVRQQGVPAVSSVADGVAADSHGVQRTAEWDATQQRLSVAIRTSDTGQGVPVNDGDMIHEARIFRIGYAADDALLTATDQGTVIDDYVKERVAEHYSRLLTDALDEDAYDSEALTAAQLAATAVADDSDETDDEHEWDDLNIPMIAAVEMGDELLDITELGIGGVPDSELANKPTASTPADHEHEYKPQRDKILSHISSLLKANESITGFCTADGSVVELTVKAEDEHHIFTRQYRTANSLVQAVDDCLKRWFDEGRIELAPQGCKFNSSLLPVMKKDDKGKMTGVRICLDVRKLNKYIVEDDRHEIPHIPDVLATLAGGRIFGEFDLSEAYFQFQLAQKSRRYTAFTWKNKQYVFNACPYGIKHIPSLFQRFITQLFRDMPFVFTYIDNICFSSKSWKEHLVHAIAIIERLNSVNLRIKPSSVNLGQYQIKLLGHLITPSGIGLDPEKQDIIMKWPKPSTGSELASFLGLGTFLRDHIRYYADITAPFEKMKRTTSIDWTPLLEQQWDVVKRAFATAPFLTFPDFSKRFVVATDASQTGIGGILYQPADDANTITATNIVAIVSKQLNETQRRYPVYKKELWAVVYCLRKFHSFIHNRRDVTVLTDHKPLIHILKQQNLCAALQQWLDVLLDYDLTIMYRPGALHVIPDALGCT